MKLYNTKLLLLGVAFIAFFSSMGKAQTYFSLIAGGSFMKMEEGKNLNKVGPIAIMEEGWISSWQAGLGVERHLSEKYLLAWNNTYIHQQDFSFVISSILPITGTKFSVWRSTLALKRELLDGVVVGIGPSLDYFHDLNFVTQTGLEFDVQDYDNNIGYAAHASAAYYYKRYMLELSYFKGLGYRSDYSHFIAPADALTLSFIVQFKSPWADKARKRGKLRF